MLSTEAIVGTIVTVIVMPVVGFVANLAVKQNALATRVGVIETDQKWIMQTLTKVETSQNGIASSQLEMNVTQAKMEGTLATIAEHLLAKASAPRNR